MTPNDFRKILERIQPEPQPTIHQWLQQWLFYFTQIIRPHISHDGKTEYLLDIGSGWGMYKLRDDLPDDCRQAIKGMSVVRDLQACVDTNDSPIGGMRLVVQASYDLGRIAANRSNTPPPIASTNDPRDEWMHSRKLAGETHSQIRHALGKEHPEWDSLDTEQAVGRAIDRYCERKGIQLLRRKKN